LRPAPSFAILTRDGFRLFVSGMTGPCGASQAIPDGRKPEPGGWNRIQIEVGYLEAKVTALRQTGARFRNEIDRVSGRIIEQDLLAADAL
ncbi:hypothetical protein ACC853_37515, partial [Rhizobium johnstonii]